MVLWANIAMAMPCHGWGCPWQSSRTTTSAHHSQSAVLIKSSVDSIQKLTMNVQSLAHFLFNVIRYWSLTMNWLTWSRTMNSRSKRDRRESCIPMLSMGFLYSSYYKDSNKNGFRIKGARSKMAAKESWFSLNTKQQSIWNRKPAQNWHLRLLPLFVSHFYWLSIIKTDTSKLQTIIIIITIIIFASLSVMSSPRKHITNESDRLHNHSTQLTKV